MHMALMENGRKTRHILNLADNMRRCAIGIFHRHSSSSPSVVNVASLSPQQRVLLTQAFSPRQTYSFAPFNLKCLSGSPAGSRGSRFTCSVPGCRVRSVRTGSHCAQVVEQRDSSFVQCVCALDSDNTLSFTNKS